MLKSLEIENFRGFRSFSADLGPVTAFMGPNSSGKTTVLHAVRLASSLLERALEADARAKVETIDGAKWIEVASGELVPDPARLVSLADWRALYTDQEVREGVALRIELGFDEGDPIERLRVALVCARNRQVKLDVKVLAPAALARIAGVGSRARARTSPLISPRLREYLVDHSPRAVLVPPFYGTVLGEEYRARAVIDQLLGSGDQSHVVRNLVASLEHDRFESLNTFLDDALGVRLSYRTTGDALQTESPLVVRFRDTNGDIEISAAGAGLVNLVALYASLSRWRLEGQSRSLLFLLDEPEAHLHPRLQAQSAERLAQLVTGDFGAQLLLATHSVDILNRLSEAGARLVRCDRTAEPAAVALDSDAALFEDLAGWVDLTPYTAINFLASRRIVFCEGEDDETALTRLAELRFRDDPEKLRRFRRWAIVPLGGVGQHRIAKLVARLVKSEAVRARGKDGAFRLLLLLDRDYEREPGWRTDQGAAGNVKESQFVWSRHSIESVLIEPRTLAIWLKAFLGESTPPELPAIIERAVAKADTDEELQQSAEEQLVAELLRGKVRDAKNEQQAVVRVLREARKAVSDAPAVWQRGKDRAARVLGAIREELGHEQRSQLPTDVIRLLARLDLARVPSPAAAVPPEVSAVLEHMTQGA